MAIVTGLQFDDLPAGGASFSGKGLEDRPRRISIGNAGNKCGRNAGPAIGQKKKWLLKATQTEITQPSAHEIRRLAGLQSPEIEVALPAR